MKRKTLRTAHNLYAGVRVRVGALIENTGCFPGSSVWNNLMMQAINLGIGDRDEEIRRVLRRTSLV